jgi:hypothetical protein
VSTPDGGKRTRIVVAGVIGVALTLAASGLPLWASEPEAAAVGSQDTGGQRVVVGSTPKEEPYADKWRPWFLYLSENAIFAADSHSEVFKYTLKEGVITGLAVGPCGDVVVYALTSRTGARLMAVRTSLDRYARLGDATEMGKDAWFQDPMSLSGDEHWLLVTVSPKRGEMLAERAAGKNKESDSFETYPGDLWLLDCKKKVPPRRIAPNCRLLGCAWASRGSRAICQLASPDGSEVRTALVDPESGDVATLVEGAAHAMWLPGGEKVRLFRALAYGTEMLDFTVSEKPIPPPHSRVVSHYLPKDPLWSSDGRMAAFLEQQGAEKEQGVHEQGGPVGERNASEKPGAAEKQPVEDKEGLMLGMSVLSASGALATAQDKARARSLLGWSCAGEMLAYVGGDGCLHFCVGAVSADSLESFVSLMPEVKGVESPREAYGLGTSKSPVRVASKSVMGAWAEGTEGPCLIYVDVPKEGEQIMYRLAFKRMSLAKFGIDVKGNVREQISKQVSMSNLRQVALALRMYARDHGNRLPPHATGDELLQDLRPYLGSPALMSSPYGAGVIKVVLLYPGEDIRQFEAKELTRMPIVELWSDYGQVYVGYASGGVERLQ